MQTLIRFGQIAAIVIAMASSAGAEIVDSLARAGSRPTPGLWYASDTRAGGEVAIVSLGRTGGVLESGQPLPGGVLRLTTGTDAADKAEVGLADAFGLVADIFTSLTLGYDFHKSRVADGNSAAAPAIKLAFWNENHDAVAGQDGYVQLVYEPYVNLGHDPAPDAWHRVRIDEHNGRFWSTGGFGHANSAGGPPYRTLAQWREVMHADFAGATLVQLSIGVGSHDRGQHGFVDRVTISHESGDGHSAVYDFEPTTDDREVTAATTGISATRPATRIALASALVIAGLRRRRRS